MKEQSRTKMLAHDIPLRAVKLIECHSYDNTVCLVLVWVLCRTDGKQLL